MKHEGIALLVRDVGLANALRRCLQDVIDAPSVTLDRMVELPPSTVILTTTSDCPPSVCGGLTERGLRIVVLAALPNDAQAKHYERIGAIAYVPMEVSAESLRHLVSGFLSAPREDPL